MKTNTQFPTLYAKTATGQINYWYIWTDGAYVLTEWGQMGTSNPQQEKYKAEGKNKGRANETTPAEQAVLEAQSKFDRQKRLKYFLTIREAESITNLKPMRAYSLDAARKAKLKFPVNEQPKYNGVRCMAYNLPSEEVRLMSRGGKDYVMPHIQQELSGRIPDGWCLDGELYIHGVMLQTIRHLIADKSERVEFVVYDMLTIPPGDMPWEERMRTMGSWFGVNKLPHVKMTETLYVDSMQELIQHHDFWVLSGYEGAMIRTRKGVYKMAAKSPDLLKLKDFQDAEFKVIGWSVGKDGVILYKCVQEEGLEFDVRPIGNDEWRAQLLKTADADVGKLLTVKYQERSKDNIPIHARGVAFRGEEDLD